MPAPTSSGPPTGRIATTSTTEPSPSPSTGLASHPTSASRGRRPRSPSSGWARDFRSWISIEQGTVALLDELHAGGTRLAILSNAGFDFGDPFRRSPFGRYFERVFVSAELGKLKTHADVYEHVARELGIGFDAFVFIDNKAPNVDAAVALGATGHHFTGVDGLRAFLTGLAQG
jgi:putative hydrolase of the HAD superfamily